MPAELPFAAPKAIFRDEANLRAGIARMREATQSSWGMTTSEIEDEDLVRADNLCPSSVGIGGARAGTGRPLLRSSWVCGG